MTSPAPRIGIGIIGYGNLGRGVERALTLTPDMELRGIFTRRDPQSVQPENPAVPVRPLAALDDHGAGLDVLILCGGSKQDLPEQGPALAARFNTVDSFDTHARVPDYFAAMDRAARDGNRVAMISIGWDPGLFSLHRMLSEAILPTGETYTFWGKGISQGHSDAIRRVPGVQAGVQYTLPSEDAIAQVRSGSRPELSTRQRHTRECFVVLAEGADAQQVQQAIVTMPDYFADYDTTVHFVTQETLQRDHSAMPHGGFVIHSGETPGPEKQIMEFSIQLESNPGFTASVLVAYARATHRLFQAGERGARTLFDVAPGLLSPHAPADLRKRLL